MCVLKKQGQNKSTNYKFCLFKEADVKLKIKMKKLFVILVAFIGFNINANAQVPVKSATKAQPTKSETKTQSQDLGKKIENYVEKANQPKEVREQRKIEERANTKNETAKEIDKFLEKKEKQK
jgi:hypothetical protein